MLWECREDVAVGLLTADRGGEGLGAGGVGVAVWEGAQGYCHLAGHHERKLLQSTPATSESSLLQTSTSIAIHLLIMFSGVRN